MDIMLDLETMGTHSDAAIVAIGAVQFDLATRFVGNPFYTAVDLKSAVEAGGIIDAETVMWWLEQSDTARSALKHGKKINVALEEFAVYITNAGGRREVKVWGNGSDFDNVILGNAYRRGDWPTPPWSFSKNRCYRTVKAHHPGIAIQRVGTHHNAVEDAITQANHLMAMIGGTAW